MIGYPNTSQLEVYGPGSWCTVSTPKHFLSICIFPIFLPKKCCKPQQGDVDRGKDFPNHWSLVYHIRSATFPALGWSILKGMLIGPDTARFAKLQELLAQNSWTDFLNLSVFSWTCDILIHIVTLISCYLLIPNW